MSKQINDLNKSLKDKLDLDKKQDKTDNDLITTDKTIVGAINELFQSANNGKQLIASAIGEPLSAEDTFSAMSNDINGLLSTFKTNMMNNGVMIESSDKFKQLIDKIKGLTEGEGNKGIKYAEGIIDVENVTLGNDKWLTYEIPYNIDFDPTILLICISKWGMSSTNKNDCILVICDKFSNSEDTATRFKVPNMTETYLECYITNTTSTGCTLNYYTTSSTWDNIGGFSYVAIGVGEEDTALRDSLASILQEEGVSITEEDDMASLISKVDQEFDRQVVPQGTAVASNVLTGKTFINNTGQTITGTMTNNGTKTITPKANAQTLGAGYYDKITINGDADLVAANIVSGKNIFGVAGTAKKNNFPDWIISGGTWYNVASMTKSRSHAAVATVGDNIYVIGGMNGANGRSGGDNECYNTITNTWTTKTAGYGSMDTFFGVVNSNIYRSGLRGYNTYHGLNNSCYNVNTDTWTDKANLPQSRGSGGKSFVINNKYYCVGGYYSNYTQTNYCYDESTNTWTTKQDMPSVPSQNNSAMGVYNNKFYLIDSGNLYVYNPSSNTWTSETMSTRYANGNTYGHSCIGNKIYLRGSNVYYNIDTKTFHSIKGSTNTTPSGLTCSMHNDALYYFGGSYWNGSSYVYYVLGEIYIPE